MRVPTLPLALLAIVTCSITVRSQPHQPPPPWLDAYREPARRLLGESLGSDFAWQRLAVLGDTFGHRLSGSAALEHAITWARAR